MGEIRPIGVVASARDGGALVRLDTVAPEALAGLDGFGYVQVLWWAHEVAQAERSVATIRSPYRGGPPTLGVLATRSPARPNPIGLSVAALLAVDHARGVLHLAHLDAVPGTPVLDVKPYTPSLDRVARPSVPDWCAGWPDDLESSGTFDWRTVLAD